MDFATLFVMIVFAGLVPVFVLIALIILLLYRCSLLFPEQRRNHSEGPGYGLAMVPIVQQVQGQVE